MIKKLILCVPVWTLASGTAIAGDLNPINPIYSKCCSGNMCIEGIGGIGISCKECVSNADCGEVTPVIPECPKECPNTDWTLVDSNIALPGVPQYEVQCNTNTLPWTCDYRCHSGSYGNPTSSSDGCYACPRTDALISGAMVSSWNEGSSKSGATKITDCYMPVGSYKDDTGTYKISEECYYKE